MSISSLFPYFFSHFINPGSLNLVGLTRSAGWNKVKIRTRYVQDGCQRGARPGWCGHVVGKGAYLPWSFFSSLMSASTPFFISMMASYSVRPRRRLLEMS